MLKEKKGKRKKKSFKFFIHKELHVYSLKIYTVYVILLYIYKIYRTDTNLKTVTLLIFKL